ncbi:MAG: hypothetical protein HWD59_04605 [Coxiellaceae bacterium]|nr:MAG: hypothetical protein HWD59_04605 [Coxiellaceae bacterium]
MVISNVRTLNKGKSDEICPQSVDCTKFKNQSSIIEDSFAKDIDHFMTGVDAAVSINLWSSNTSPASLDAKDPTIAGLPFLPAKQGTVFRLCDFPPDATYMNRLDEILLNGEKITAEQKSKNIQ